MVNIEKHKLMLVQILKDIYSDTDISSRVGFKGGTALYLFYNLPRFSVDLDFNLLDNSAKESVYEKMSDILQKFGTIKDKNQKRSTLFFLLSYGEEERNIKVEISLRLFPDSYELKNYFGITMQVMKKEDMLAHKLAALLDRKSMANRDLFDIWFLMKEKCPINEKLLKVRVNESLTAYLEKCITAVDKVNSAHILQGLGDVLDKDMKEWAKKNLKKELLFLLNFYKENPLIK